MDAERSAMVVVTPGAVPVLSRPEAAGKQLVVVPVDRSGTVRLSPDLLERLRIAPIVKGQPADFQIEPHERGIARAYLVTLDGSGAREAITRNLPALLNSDGAREYGRIWLPLMGIEGGGLSRQESLSLILAAIGVAERPQQRFAVATADDIPQDELISLRAQVESAAGRPLLDLGSALQREGIAADDETAAVLNIAGHLMLQQRPGRDNGRISTRLALLALLHAGSISSGSPVAVALHSAWERLAPKAFDAAQAKYFRSVSPVMGPALPPVIIARHLAEALAAAGRGPTMVAARLAAGQAGGETIGLLHVANALIEQAQADEQRRTFSRQVMDEARVSPASLRKAFAEELIKGGIAIPADYKPMSFPDEPDEEPKPAERDVITSVLADKPDTRSDALRSRAEAVALARIAALEQTTPPLAIGIFGDWGAGKTSFMDMIRKEIEEIENKQRHAPYCEGIVQISFNAWHFIETNLWASLVSHIFTELDRKLDPEIGDALYGQLTTARHVEAEAARQVIASKTALDQAHTDAEHAQEGASGRLHVGSLAGLAVKTFYEQLGSDDRAKVDQAVKDLGITDGEKAWEKADHAVRESRSLFRRARLAFVEMRRRRESGDYTPLIWGGTLILALVLAVVLGGAIADWLGATSHLLGPTLGLLGGIGTATLGAVTVLSRLPSLAGGVFDLFERASRQREEARRLALAGAEKDVAEHRAQLAEAAAAFRTATPLGRLTRFIEAKAADEAYAKNLGLVAMIRRDFEVLTRCMLDGKEVAKLTGHTSREEKQISREEKQIATAREILHALVGQPIPSGAGRATVQRELKPFRRIILYIDDLDRCATDKVVEVLQAVHLLLAFELFVVVMAVDYRWIRAALERSYGSQLHSGNENGQAATAADYLEKIFQIPYWVRRLDRDTSVDFLRGLIDATREPSAPPADIASRADALLDKASPPVPQAAPPDQPRAVTATAARHLDRRFETVGTAANAVKHFFFRLISKPHSDVGPPQAAAEPTQDAAQARDNAGGTTATPQRTEAHSNDPTPPVPIDITDEEKTLILALAPYAGRTPRQLKRFFNVYRVIKAAANDSEMPGRAVLALLAIATRAPGQFGTLVQALDRATDTAQLKQILETQGFAAHEDGMTCLAVLATVEGAVTLADLKAQAPIVARFSFSEPNWSRPLPGPGHEEGPAARAALREAARPQPGLAVVN